MACHPYLDVDGPIAFAHRGGAEEFPENTLRAFRHAVNLGFTHVETDVHATADGVAVAFHDHSLDRVTDGRGAVRDLAWSRLRRALVAGSDPILRLDELLEELPDTRVNIDPKSDAAVGPLAEVLRRSGAVERVCVCSFSDRRTQQVRDRTGDSLCVGAGPRGMARLLAASARPRRPARLEAERIGERIRPIRARPWAVLSGFGRPVSAANKIGNDPSATRRALTNSRTRFDFQAAQVPVRFRGLTLVRPGVLAEAHRRGVAVHVWTIDEPAEMHRLLDMGVDGIMTDRPSVLRQAMIDRGHWKP